MTFQPTTLDFQSAYEAYQLLSKALTDSEREFEPEAVGAAALMLARLALTNGTPGVTSMEDLQVMVEEMSLFVATWEIQKGKPN